MPDRVGRARRAVARALAAPLLIAAAAAPLGAQKLLTPELLLQPGVRTVDVFADENPYGASTGFDVRFVTIVPTTWRHVSLMVGASFTPFGMSNGNRIANDPILFYGASIPLVRERRTDGWLALSLPVLGVYQYDLTGRGNDRLYEHDLVLELSATAHVGRKLLSDLGPFWSRLDAYLLIDQMLTPDRELSNRRRDRFNPVFMYGVAIPLGGAPR